MDFVTLLLSGGVLVAALVVLYNNIISSSQSLKDINKLPGPTPYPLFGNLLPVMFLKRNEMFNYGQKHIQSKYKSMFRTWMLNKPIVHLKTPEEIEVIVKSSDHIDKGDYYSILFDWLGTGLLTATGEKWHCHRKLITPAFHFKILENFINVFAEKSEILVEKLRKEVGSQGFDVFPYVTKCALDIICETAMGTPVYAQDDHGADYVEAVEDIIDISIKRIIRPWLVIPFVFKMSKLGEHHAQCLKILNGFTNRVIAERKQQLMEQANVSESLSSDEDAFIGKKSRKAFLDLLLEVLKDGNRLTDEELRDEVNTFMFGGHHTTSTGISWALFLMGLYPDVQEKAYEEQESIFQGSDRTVTMKDLNEMKYLERVIKETLRLYPSVPGVSRKLKYDTYIGGYEIPAGITVQLEIYNLHRSPDHFPNPENFDPDNFLPERVINRHPYAFIPFSAGPRNCIGQKFALLEEKTVLSYILRNYKVKSLDTRDSITLMAEVVLHPEKGINLTITPRREISDA